MMIRPESNRSAPNTAPALSMCPAPPNPTPPPIFRPPHFETEICQYGRTLISGISEPVQAFDSQHDVVAYLSVPMSEQFLHLAANHEPDNAINRDVFNCAATH